MSSNDPQDWYVAYGSDTNCTLAVCPVEWSVLGYQPSVAANAVFVALFALALVIHLVEGLRWRHTLGAFAVPMILGCLDEIAGYVGRLVLHHNPFSFEGFIVEIVCITTAPVFFCAAIYVTLARTINYLDPLLARFNPKYFYWIFIPCDVISLVFQAAGGALSSTDDSGGDDIGVDLSLFGLSFQVVTLVIFIGFSMDYLVRYLRASRGRSHSVNYAMKAHTTNPTRFRIFVVGLAAGILFILIRCIYRIDELSQGYNGDLFRDENTFYGLESAMVTLAVLCLAVGQPGLGLGQQQQSSGGEQFYFPDQEQSQSQQATEMAGASSDGSKRSTLRTAMR